MAGLAHSHGLGEQVALIAGLRFRLFRNSLRTWRGRLELIALVLLVALGALGAAGIGFGLGAGAFLLLSEGRVQSLAWLLWIVFICWQVVPVVLAGFMAEFDFRNLLHFPLRFSTFVLLSLLYGLFEPAAVVAIFWTLCISAGIFLAG